MSNLTKLNLGYLDFDTIKASLRDYLRSQSQFKDYDFEGSGMSVLLDILAYNTHYFGYYMNMIGNEMFLDSANLRSSVVSLAKHLGYTPRSITSARARISIDIDRTNDAASAVIEKNTPFTSSVDGTTLTFVTDRAYGATVDSDGFFRFPDVTLVEGTAYTYRIVVDKTIPRQRFVIPNVNVDTQTISVRVQKSRTDTTLETFILAETVLELKSDTKAYFIQEVEDQKFEIVFGDGIIGKALEDGNVVIIDYIISKGEVGNGASSFSAAIPLAGYSASVTSITTLVAAAGGLDSETTDQIRFAAPKNFEAQARAVTVSDYKFHIQQDYTNVDSVAVWGGEDSVPPQYGKVFVSIKPVKGYVLTDQAKALVISNIIRKKNMVTVIPEFLDPDYTFIIVNCKVRYNPSNTFKTEGDIRAGAYDAVVTYASEELDKFDRELRYSRLLSSIDNSDASITNNLTTVQMKKTFQPALDVIANYELDYYNPIEPGTLFSSSFVVVHDPLLLVPYTNGKTYTLLDDREGTINLWEHGIGIPDAIVREAGTIDYETGRVTLNEFMPYLADEEGEIDITVNPLENDIVPVRNNILYVRPEDIQVTVIAINPK